MNADAVAGIEVKDFEYVTTLLSMRGAALPQALAPSRFSLLEVRAVGPSGVMVESAGRVVLVPIEELNLIEVFLVRRLLSLPPLAADAERRRPPPGTQVTGLPGMEAQAMFAVAPAPPSREPSPLERERERLERARERPAKQDVLLELDRFETDKRQRRLM